MKEEEKIFDDLYLAEVKGRTRTSDGDFTTVGNQDLQEIKQILKHLIEKLDKISDKRDRLIIYYEKIDQKTKITKSTK